MDLVVNFVRIYVVKSPVTSPRNNNLRDCVGKGSPVNCHQSYKRAAARAGSLITHTPVTEQWF